MTGEEAAREFRDTLGAIRSEVAKVFIGQEDVVEGVLVCLAANGHALLEGMPGLGKTLLVRTLAQALDLPFGRIQFTPDMMPADVTGTNVLAQDESGARRFEFRRGPVFTNLLLADEINRATPKTQSALLEAMQERSVTVGGAKHELTEPFLVMATQNPVEQEGTYPLPEAQLDRFFYKLIVPYPTREELAEIVNATTGSKTASASQVSSGADVLNVRDIVREVPVADSVLQYGLSLIVGTHPEGEGASPEATKYCRYGASPRGAQTIVTAGKIYALLDGRYNVSKEDLKKAAKPALRHRIILNFEAEADGVTPDQVIDGVIAHVEAGDKDPIGV
ncbi:MAG TPA: MoxR family ATPase [Fimbriimonadaceae bacterium]|nr:MoxR family ATPase [Fimbriimonadaceae bacterium]